MVLTDVSADELVHDAKAVRKPCTDGMSHVEETLHVSTQNSIKCTYIRLNVLILHHSALISASHSLLCG